MGTTAMFDESDVLRMVDLFARRAWRDAVRLAKALAREREATAMEYLGHAYSEGLGVRQSMNAGTQWYKRAWRASGQPHLCINIAVNHANAGNRRQAKHW